MNKTGIIKKKQVGLNVIDCLLAFEYIFNIKIKL